MQVTTAPVRDATGEVIGRVEMFQDVSSMWWISNELNSFNLEALNWIFNTFAFFNFRLRILYIPGKIYESFRTQRESPS